MVEQISLSEIILDPSIKDDIRQNIEIDRGSGTSRQSGTPSFDATQPQSHSNNTRSQYDPGT